MRDISLHVLDIVMNSIKANATLIEITIIETTSKVSVTIKDNGQGMSEDYVKHVLDPFLTSRTTRKVGIPLLYQNVKKTAGEFTIESKLNQGTLVKAVFNKNHIDCIPLGDMEATIITLITLEPKVDFIYRFKTCNEEFVLNTLEMK